LLCELPFVGLLEVLLLLSCRRFDFHTAARRIHSFVAVPRFFFSFWYVVVLMKRRRTWSGSLATRR
jgi:hypothetical protein